MEIHSTILIDRKGRLHWARSGGEPFGDMDFLVKQIERMEKSGAGSDSYAAEIEQWRRDSERDLTSDDGWLTVAGLEWLEEGQAVAGLAPGMTFTLRRGRVFLNENGAERPLAPDNTGNPDRITSGSRTILAIQRGPRTGLRIRDRDSKFRREFTGMKWYPVDPKWRVEAKWQPYAKPVERLIDSAGGIQQKLTASGIAEFTLGGAMHRLEAIAEPGKLFFVFKDATARTATYPGGRFLYTALPEGARVVLDFNRAENPPCAFTPYATCPLAPARNHLAVSIEAGEKRYHD